MKEKIVTYPMLGKQSSFTQDITNFGFKVVSTSVMAYGLNNINSINKTKEVPPIPLPIGYTITNWKHSYYKDAADIIHQAFKDSYDALFDSRFKTEKGCKDIVNKITNNVYGRFLPSITKVLVYKKRPVGIYFANLTNEKIANVPIAAIMKQHRNYGFGKLLLKQLVDNLLSAAITEGWTLKELNASCDSDNIPAVNMYKAIGFTEQYSYPQAYHPII